MTRPDLEAWRGARNDARRLRGPAPVVPWENVAHDESIV